MTEFDNKRKNPLKIPAEDFRKIGYELVDTLLEFYQTLPDQKVTSGESPKIIRSFLGDSALPENGETPKAIIESTLELLTQHSLFTGHPKFMGFICGSGTPIGTFSEMITATLNPNVGGHVLSPMATEIELQTIRWIADFIGYPKECGGLLVSGGNMANFVGFIAARAAKASWNVRKEGIRQSSSGEMKIYASKETHTWIQKAADLFGFGTNSIQWITTDDQKRMDIDALQYWIRKDLKNGDIPFLVVGSAGTVSTGAVDPLEEIAKICEENNLWFHVDGAYGGIVAGLPEAHPDFKAIAKADSVAVDPHKWLYASLEAGCVLVKDPSTLINAFSYRPPYYKFEEQPDDMPVNFYEYGLQNSRGFKALKVWMSFRQAGRQGYIQMIRDDIAIAGQAYEFLNAHPDIEVFSNNLSIVTFRYRPTWLDYEQDDLDETLNKINTDLLLELQAGGEVFLSNAIVDNIFLLRLCIVNINTQESDVRALPEIIARNGRQLLENNRSKT